ncbi:3458_t:CDS:2, partial [Gigaspora rosea]
YKTQNETCKSTEEETHNYIRIQWVSEDFNAKDLKSSNISQPFTIVSPNKQLPIDNDISSIPAQYLMLLKSEIFHTTYTSDSTSSELWNEFGQWAGFFKVPDLRKKFHYHCCRIWTKINHAYNLQVEAQKNPLEFYGIPEVLQRHLDNRLIIADETTKKVAGGVHLDSYKYISKSQCFKNAVGETLVDFFDLTNSLATETAQNIVDQYYNHALSSSSHQSNQFARDLIEHFGCFTNSNNELYVTANTASSYCEEHQKCVRELIQELQPISDAVNNYFGIIYPTLASRITKIIARMYR